MHLEFRNDVKLNVVVLPHSGSAEVTSKIGLCTATALWSHANMTHNATASASSCAQTMWAPDVAQSPSTGSGQGSTIQWP